MFYNCHTPAELKKRYRELCNQLHPDKGGTTGQFQDMQAQYEDRKRFIENSRCKTTLYEHFNVNESYEYYRRAIKYVGIVYNYYYKFEQVFGADILIDSNNIQLIFVKHKVI